MSLFKKYDSAFLNEELNENDYENKNDNSDFDADGVNGDGCAN